MIIRYHFLIKIDDLFSGSSIGFCVCFMVCCRMKTQKKRSRKRNTASDVGDGDYLVNGMYL